MAAVPATGRATGVEGPVAREADATRALYERYAGQIFGYCLHQLGSREEAEDAVQTTFLNAFRGFSRGIVPELESAWVFKIAHNVCLSRRRSSWRRGRIEAPNNFEVLQEVVPARERGGDELIRLQDVLEEMPENQRRAILLREWQGLSYREIADELEVSQAAVETLIFRARRALAQGLEEAPSAEGWRKRACRDADLGGVLTVVKTLFGGGGAAVKVAATVAAITATAVVGGSGVGPRSDHRPRAAAPSRIAAMSATEARPTAVGSRHAPATVPPASAPIAHPSRPAVRATAPAVTRSAPLARAEPQLEAPAPAEASAAAPASEGRGTAGRPQGKIGKAVVPPAAIVAEHGDNRQGKAGDKSRKDQATGAQPGASGPQPVPPRSETQPEPTPPGQQDKAAKDTGNAHGNGK